MHSAKALEIKRHLIQIQKAETAKMELELKISEMESEIERKKEAIISQDEHIKTQKGLIKALQDQE